MARPLEQCAPMPPVHLLQNDAEVLAEDAIRERASTSTVIDVVFGAPRDFDISADSVAYFTVSTEEGHRGTILDANAAALDFFGFPRNEFVGRDHGIIIPAVLGHKHHGMIARFARDGVVRVTQNSRLIFCQSRDGLLMPIVASIRSMDGCLGFACDRVATPQSFLWFGGEAEVRKESPPSLILGTIAMHSPRTELDCRHCLSIRPCAPTHECC